MASEKPDYVNDVPEGWPEGRRCQHVFVRYGKFHDSYVKDRLCGYPTSFGEDRCIFHLDARPTDSPIRAELERAVRAGAYLGEANLHSLELLGVVPGWTGPGPQPLQIPGAHLNWADLQRTMLTRASLPKACLAHAQLRYLDLTEATASGADFSAARLQDAMLSAARLDGAHLNDAVLERAYLYHTSMMDAELRRARLKGAHLDNATLRDADLRGTVFAGAGLREANLRGARAQRASFTGRANLLRAVLIDASLSGAAFSPEADLDGVTWWRTPVHAGKVTSHLWHAARRGRFWRMWYRLRAHRQAHFPAFMFRDEREALGGPPREGKQRDKWYETIAGCERTYRQIKLCYQNSGQYEEAGVFFIREMECKRKQSTGPRRAKLGLMYLLCAYGERPLRVARIGAFLILLTAVVQGLIGVQVAPEGNYVVGPGVNGGDFKAHLDAVIRAVYFSVMTFTATGYGDYVPRPGWGQVLAATEAVCGVFLMALFLVCLARKYGRA